MRLGIRSVFLATALLWAGVCVAAQPPVERLIDDLRTGNEAAKLRASQLLPHSGAVAVPGLVALIGHSDPVVAKAAYNALWFTVNQLARPGMDEERKTAAEALLPLIAPERTRDEKEKGLKLLGVVVPEGFDTSPIAALLTDKEFGEKARFALERIDTAQSRTDLRRALKDAEPDRACALIGSLETLRDRASVPALLDLTSHADPRVRVAAARAVAWTGEPSAATAVRQVRAQADDATAFAAADAQLRLADAMAEGGGNWNAAIALYREILDSAQDPRLENAAIVGLARHGDETVVAPIVQAAQAAGEEMQPLLLTAFAYLPGAASSKQIIAALPSFSPELKLALMPVLGRRGDAAMLPALVEAAQSSDSALRLAGLRALGDCRQPEAIHTLAEAGRTGGEEESKVAEESGVKLADTLYDRTFYPEAGRAYAVLLDYARTNEARVRALQGIAKSPSPEAYDVILARVAAEPGLRADAGAALKAIAELFARDNNRPKALEAYETLIHKVDPSAGTVFAVAGRIRELGGNLDDAAAYLGVVKKWRVVGPFPASEKDYDTPFIGEPAVDPAATYTAGDAQITWKPVTVGDNGQVDLLAAVGNVTAKFAYAYAEITLEKDTDATVLLGTDDGFRLWLNGELVKEVRANRGIVVDSDRADVRLKAGKNTLLLKVYQNAMGWGYCVRFTDRGGQGLAFAQPE